MTLPPEIILEIVKYCHESALLALTRTCRQFSNKDVMIDDDAFIYDTDSHSKNKKLGISRSEIWKNATIAQFPNKTYLPFYDDMLNYFLAKTGEFMLLYDVLQYQPDWIYENSDEFYGILSFVSRNEQYDWITFPTIENRILVVSLDANVFDWCDSFDDVRTKFDISPAKNEDPDILVIDLLMIDIKLWKKKVFSNVRMNYYSSMSYKLNT